MQALCILDLTFGFCMRNYQRIRFLSSRVLKGSASDKIRRNIFSNLQGLKPGQGINMTNNHTAKKVFTQIAQSTESWSKLVEGNLNKWPQPVFPERSAPAAVANGNQDIKEQAHDNAFD